MEKRTVIYARISTANQSHDSQLRELREYCTSRGFAVVDEIEDTVSGGQISRRGLDGLMAQVRRGRVGIILVQKLDRLARSLSHLAQIFAELRSHGTALVCPSQGIDTTNANPAAHLQMNILGAVAEFERDLIRERVRAGLEAAKQRGVKLGRPATAKRHLDDVTGLYAGGVGQKAISERLGLPLSTTGDLIAQAKAQKLGCSTELSDARRCAS